MEDQLQENWCSGSHMKSTDKAVAVAVAVVVVLVQWLSDNTEHALLIQWSWHNAHWPCISNIIKKNMFLSGTSTGFIGIFLNRRFTLKLC